jgi:isocitrate lyase
MNQSSQRVIVGLSVVLLAGCSGLATSGSSPTATSPASEYPPGTTPDSVAEPFTLAGAHADALDAS